ncbi:MAG: hypothetical protein PHE51_04885 [Eubacteriales bacterium]|nr:hypothetical protein [Eubacteriales bacterium]
MITIDDFKEFVKDEKNLGTFREVAKTLGFEEPEEIQGLLRKNQELIEKYKKIRKENEDIRKKLDEIDVDEYIELKEKSKTNPKTSDELTKIQRDLKKTADELEKERKIRLENEAYLEKTLKESALIEALDSNGFDIKHREILKSAFHGRARVEVEDDKRTVVIDEDGLGLPVKDYFKKYATTETGKTYLKQPENKGTGSSGFSGSGGAKILKRSSFNEMSNKEQMTMIKDGYKIID